jgi:hypothetical protein
MQLLELQIRIVDKLGESYDSDKITFAKNIHKCKDTWDILKVLDDYGYDKQGALDILFSILVN